MDFKGHQRLAARDSICAAAMTPLGRLGRQWNQTGLIFPQDWRYRPAHLCWEWDPSLDLHQIFIAPAHKKTECVSELVDWQLSASRWMWNGSACVSSGDFYKTCQRLFEFERICVGAPVQSNWNAAAALCTLIAWFFQSPHKALKPRGAQRACSLVWLDFKGKCFFLLFGNKHIYILIKSSMRRLITLWWWMFVL